MADNGEGEQEAGWYDTGDIVSFDEGGFCQIQGRAKRFAKIAGEMVSLESVEQIALKASAEKQHAASLRPMASAVKRWCCLPPTVNSAASGCSRPRVRWVRQSWPCRDIRYMKQLPMLGSGKPDYVSLKQLAEEERA